MNKSVKNENYKEFSRESTKSQRLVKAKIRSVTASSMEFKIILIDIQLLFL